MWKSCVLQTSGSWAGVQSNFYFIQTFGSRPRKSHSNSNMGLEGQPLLLLSCKSWKGVNASGHQNWGSIGCDRVASQQHPFPTQLLATFHWTQSSFAGDTPWQGLRLAQRKPIFDLLGTDFCASELATCRETWCGPEPDLLGSSRTRWILRSASDACDCVPACGRNLPLVGAGGTGVSSAQISHSRTLHSSFDRPSDGAFRSPLRRRSNRR